MSLDDALKAELDPRDAKIAELQNEVAANKGHIEVLAQDLTDLANTVEALKGGGGGGPEPAPDPGPTPGPQPDPPTETSDLSINISFERYTNCLVPNAASPTGFKITDHRFIDLYSQYDTIRVMDWQNMIGAKHRNRIWANRITRDDYDPNATNGRWRSTGVPLEGLIEVANACNSNLWLCLYQQSDASFWQQAGVLFDRLLKRGLHVYLEGPNESVWDQRRGWFYYEQTGGSFNGIGKIYAEDCARKFRAFNENFDPRRTTRILGGQLASVGVLQSHITPHIASKDYDAICCSGYFGNSVHKGEHWRDGKHGLKDSLKDLNEHAALAKRLGKKLCIYEINQHIEGDIDLVESQPVTDGVRAMIDEAQRLGAGPICLFSGVGRRYDSSPWPLYDTNYKPRTPAIGLGLPTI